MLTVKEVTLDSGRYGEGFTCAVSFQIGPQSYNTIKVELQPQATRGVVELAISEAKALLAAEASGIKIKGEAEPLPLIEEASAPEFAEVDDMPAPRAIPADEAVL